MTAIAWAVVLATVLVMKSGMAQEVVSLMMLCISTIREWAR